MRYCFCEQYRTVFDQFTKTIPNWSDSSQLFYRTGQTVHNCFTELVRPVHKNNTALSDQSQKQYRGIVLKTTGQTSSQKQYRVRPVTVRPVHKNNTALSDQCTKQYRTVRPVHKNNTELV